ncbi:MAG TPA: pyridoxal phosphate-dependent aminotransferase [Aestuariivirgaceae bacterium]|nr:pyridoxal phosphate-dependent aminotransferase [Aestuariivirgaceae bacterium]
MLTLNPHITAIEEEGAFAVLDKALALKATGAPVINLGIGQPDFPPPPHVLDAATKAARDGPHGYTSPVGILPLREAVADHLNLRYRTAVDPDQVVIVPGGKVTFYFACLLFGGPGAEILYPDPGFPPYRHAIGSGGATAVPYPIREERDFGFDADEILSLITPNTRLLMVNSPANPTGGVVAKGELERLVAGLADHPHVAVLSDEIYSHLVFEGADFASLTTFPELADRLILLDGWSKTFAMTGWRLGYGVWPKHLVEHVRKLVTVDHSCVNGVAQMAGLAAITGPMDEVRRMAEVFAQRRDLVVDGLNRLPGVSCRMPGGAFYAFPNVRGTGIGSRELARRLLDEAHVALVPGEGFGDNGRGFLRLSYAASTEEIDEALGRMAKFLAEHSRPAA